MKDTSFAIHPDHQQTAEEVTFQDIGNVTAVSEDSEAVSLTCEYGYVRISFPAPGIARVKMDPKKMPEVTSTAAVVKQQQPEKITVQEMEEMLAVKTEEIRLSISKYPCRITMYDKDGKTITDEMQEGMSFSSRGEVRVRKKMEPEDHFYGFGEKTGFLEKRGEKMRMWNTDVFAPHNPEIDALYQSIPYFMSIRSGKAYGLYLDNTFQTEFDLKTSYETYSITADGGALDYYILAGPTPKDVIRQYTSLTGRMELPPKWALGYHQSRYSYRSEAEVRELVEAFKRKNIPLDAVHLDIHYMDEYRVFTFDEKKFPDPEKLVQDLKAEGIKIVPIVDPGVKRDETYLPYQEGMEKNHFSSYSDGSVYFGDVWPGESAFPDFFRGETRKWWEEQQAYYTNMGIEGVWNDMNEPAVFNEKKTMDNDVFHEENGVFKTHRELHNAYGLHMSQASFEGLKNKLGGKRPFVLTRAGFAGIQRYAAVWTGDNRSFWEHLQMAVPMTLNLGVSGVPFAGNDVGGFAHDTSAELLTRWTQLGTFTPFFRNHSNIGTVFQEPWAFGEKTEETIKKYIELRHKWMPHLYELFQEASETGMPVMRPMMMHYADDPNTLKLHDQFMVGEDVLVAPVTQSAAKHRIVYLPAGTWYNYWNDNEVYEGGRYIMAEADLDTLPIFIRENSAILEGRVKQNADARQESLRVHVYLGEAGSLYKRIYEDDGETLNHQNEKYFSESISISRDNGIISIEEKDIHAGYTPCWSAKTYVLHQVPETIEVYINGRKQQTVYDKADLKAFV